MASEPVSGLYEHLVTEELRRLLASLEPARVDVASPDAGDTHVAVAEHLRRIIERALKKLPKETIVEPLKKAEKARG